MEERTVDLAADGLAQAQEDVSQLGTIRFGIQDAKSHDPILVCPPPKMENRLVRWARREATNRTRTGDLSFTKASLYQLSYGGVSSNVPMFSG